MDAGMGGTNRAGGQGFAPNRNTFAGETRRVGLGRADRCTCMCLVSLLIGEFHSFPLAPSRERKVEWTSM